MSRMEDQRHVVVEVGLYTWKCGTSSFSMLRNMAISTRDILRAHFGYGSPQDADLGSAFTR
jgi:hypothetical protein